MEPKAIVVQLLGGFSVSYGPNTVRSLPRQSVSLLAYVILHRDRPQTRDLLAGRFWSDLPEDKARRRLSNTLWQIKNACLEAKLPELLDTSTSTVQVTTDFAVAVDAELFIERLEEVTGELNARHAAGRTAKRLAAVVESYAGDLLEGHYDDWIETERFRIRERYLDGLRSLVKLYKSQSDYESALRVARDLVAEAPLQEEVHQDVMRLYAMLGNASAANRQFTACAEILAAELSMQVSPKTVALRDRIRAEATRERVLEEAPGPGGPPLVGRQQDRSLLLGQADRLLSGEGGVVLIEGDPGIGKSKLVQDFVDAAQWRGVRVLAGGHTELSPLRPYDGLRDALTPATLGLRGEHLAEVLEPVWLHHVSEVFPDLKAHLPPATPRYALRPEEEPTRMGEALARVLLAQGGLQPTMIVLEDVHWSDDDTMQVLGQLGDRLARSGVLLCLTYRRFEAMQSQSIWSALDRIERAGRSTRLLLSPLGPEHVRELVSCDPVSAQLPLAAVDRLVESSGGNPLVVLERLKDPDSLLQVEDPSDSLRDGSDSDGSPAWLPESVAGTLRQRLADLPADVIAVLEAMAALAEPATTLTVAEVAGLDRRETLAALTRALESGFVDELEDGLCRFSHDQTRRALYERLAPEVRSELHGKIVNLLTEQEPAEPEQLAYHARLACRLEEAYGWHLRAADRALEIHAYRTAAEHYSQADDAANSASIDRQSRVADLLRYEAALDMLGRRSEQTLLLKQMTELDLEPAIEIDVVVRQARLLCQTDRPEEGAQLALSYLEEATEAGLPTYRLLNVIGMARLWAGHAQSAAEWTKAAFEAAPSREARTESQIFMAKALNAALQTEEAVSHAVDALASAEEANDMRNQIEALGAQAHIVSNQNGLDEAEEMVSTAVELSKAVGYRYGEGVNLVNLASICMVRGRGGMALDLFGQAAEVFGSIDNRRGEAFVRVNKAELLSLLLGDDERAVVEYEAARSYFQGIGDRFHDLVASCHLAAIDCRSGRRRVGRRRLERILRSAGEEEPLVEAYASRALARDEMEQGQDESARLHASRSRSLIEQTARSMMLPGALALEALLESRLGRDAEALKLCQQAVALNDERAEAAHVTAWWCCQVYSNLGLEEEAKAQVAVAYRRLSESLAALDEETVERSWRSVVLHQEIADGYGQRFGRFVEVSLPKIGAPTGRALRPDEMLNVVLTASEPGDWEVSSLAERRRRRIDRLTAEAVDQGAVARITDLASLLQVSDRTVKRDIAALRNLGVEPPTRRSF